jgi:hypothetical protein
MNSQPERTITISNSVPLHCRYRTPSGRRCRMTVSDPKSRLCYRHAALRARQDSGDFSPELVCGIDEFRSAEDINHVLGELYKLLAADKISPRRGAVMAYTCSLLLRTLPAIDRELDPPAQEPQIIIDLPPERDDEPQDPERAMYTRMANLYGSRPTPTNSDATAASVSPAEKTNDLR